MALKQEIAGADGFIPLSEKIETIYFGGGTPSLLTPSELSGILQQLQQKFNIDPAAEITLEANPDDISKQVLKSWMNAGINRLSLGIQSFKDGELTWMNRAHDARQSLRSIDEILEAGLSNFSADLIFGSPLLDDDELERNASIVIRKNIPHLSCYALTVEPKTALDKLIRLKTSLPMDAEKQARQFLLLSGLLEEAGYEQYEISNYAKPGMRSRHNSSYWQGKPYHGFGPSAHSFDGRNKRRWNVANNALYIKQVTSGLDCKEEEVLTKEQQLNEYIMTSLRTIEGLDPRYISSNFGMDIMKNVDENIQSFIRNGKVIQPPEGNYLLTKEGKLFADGIAATLFS